jgi:phosphoenolpyruvate-protein kinase (PTS system EI component)
MIDIDGRLVVGTPVSAGEASGPVFVVRPEITSMAGPAGDRSVAVHASMKATAERVHRLAAQAPHEAAAILNAQALIATDPALGSAIDRELNPKGVGRSTLTRPASADPR